MKIRTLSEYLKERFGLKVYRLSLSTGCTCPTRDGTKGIGGCTFCSKGGSGEFASSPSPIKEQIEEAKKKVDQKFPKGIAKEDRKYIAYFQSYTNTYTDKNISSQKLKSIFTEAINLKEVVALSIATRPDCIQDEMLSIIKELNKIKPVWIELGLQTIHEKTAKRIGRGYTLEEFEKTYKRLKEACIETIVHIILCLPGETKEDMLETVRYLSNLKPTLDGIKLQMLHILKGTALEKEYKKHPFHLPTLEEYCTLLCDCLEILPPETVVHRMTGDGDKRLLIAPEWSADKKNVLNTLKKYIEER